MKAISIKNPYATQILRGIKTIEYRNWRTDHRGDLLICSSAKPDLPGMLSGHALCVVSLVDIRYDEATGEYEWQLSNVRKIKPFPVKGKLHLFDVDDALVQFPGESGDKTGKTGKSDRKAALESFASESSVPESVAWDIPELPVTFDNVTTRVRDDLAKTITKKSRLQIAAACFSIYAWQELRKSLTGIEELQFLFTSPTFTAEQTEAAQREFHIPRLTREQSLYGTEFELRLRNPLAQRAIARECADWIRRKATFKSNRTDQVMQGFLNVTSRDKAYTYMPFDGFTAADLGCERGNFAYHFTQKLPYPL